MTVFDSVAIGGAFDASDAPDPLDVSPRSRLPGRPAWRKLRHHVMARTPNLFATMNPHALHGLRPERPASDVNRLNGSGYRARREFDEANRAATTGMSSNANAAMANQQAHQALLIVLNRLLDATYGGAPGPREESNFFGHAQFMAALRNELRAWAAAWNEQSHELSGDEEDLPAAIDALVGPAEDPEPESEAEGLGADHPPAPWEEGYFGSPLETDRECLRMFLSLASGTMECTPGAQDDWMRCGFEGVSPVGWVESGFQCGWLR